MVVELTPEVDSWTFFSGPGSQERAVEGEYRRFLTDISSHNPGNFHYLIHHPKFDKLCDNISKVPEMLLWCSLTAQTLPSTQWNGSAGIILGLGDDSRILYANATPKEAWFFDIGGRQILYSRVDRSEETTRIVEAQIAAEGRRVGILSPNEALATGAEIVVKNSSLIGIYVSQVNNQSGYSKKLQANEAMIIALQHNLPVYCFCKEGEMRGNIKFLRGLAKDLCTGQEKFPWKIYPFGRFTSSGYKTLQVIPAPATAPEAV